MRQKAQAGSMSTWLLRYGHFVTELQPKGGGEGKGTGESGGRGERAHARKNHLARREESEMMHRYEGHPTGVRSLHRAIGLAFVWPQSIIRKCAKFLTAARYSSENRVGSLLGSAEGGMGMAPVCINEM